MLFTAVPAGSLASVNVLAVGGNDGFYGDQLSTEHHYKYNDMEAVQRNPQTGAVAKIFYASLGSWSDFRKVTFKAYHFIADASGVVTGVEEIECEVTKYGLILWVEVFSPFAIATVEK